MSLTVNTNLASMRAANSLNATQGKLSHSLARISGGLRVTKAADDAAGSAVAMNLNTEARSGRQANRNANDGVSVIQTAEAASKEIIGILDRLRELAVQSSSDTLATTERAYIQTETNQLTNEIDRIADASEFNGIKLSDGSVTTLSVQVGVTSGAVSRIDISLGDLTDSGLGVNGLSLSTASSARLAIATLDTALDSVNNVRSGYGAVQNRLDSSIRNMTTYVEALSAAASRIEDTDYAHETSEMTKYQVMQQAGVAALSQAKGISQSVISLLG